MNPKPPSYKSFGAWHKSNLLSLIYICVFWCIGVIWICIWSSLSTKVLTLAQEMRIILRVMFYHRQGQQITELSVFVISVQWRFMSNNVLELFLIENWWFFLLWRECSCYFTPIDVCPGSQSQSESPYLCTSLPGFLWSISFATPTDLLTASVATHPFYHLLSQAEVTVPIHHRDRKGVVLFVFKGKALMGELHARWVLKSKDICFLWCCWWFLLINHFRQVRLLISSMFDISVIQRSLVEINHDMHKH